MTYPERDSESLLEHNLEADPAVIYLLDRQLRIKYCNHAWDRFALENGGAGLERRMQLGRCVLEAIPAPLKAFFETGYHRALVKREPWDFSYECSSPELFRTFRQTVYPAPDRNELVVVNSLFVERPHGPGPAAAPHAGYVDPHGFVTMCCHCRRACLTGSSPRWYWVADYVRNPPPSVSHGICSVCSAIFYPEYN